MMELVVDVRRLVYTIVCFQCLLQLTAGSTYQKYLKLFSELLTICICCRVIFSFCGFIDESVSQSDILYEKWSKDWEKISQEQMIYDNSSYIEKIILEESFKMYEDGGGTDARESETAMD